MITYTIEHQSGKDAVESYAAAKPYLDAMLDSSFEYVSVHASKPINGVVFAQTYLFTLEELRLLIGVQEETVRVYEYLCPPKTALALIEAFMNGEFVPDRTKFVPVK